MTCSSEERKKVDGHYLVSKWRLHFLSWFSMFRLLSCGVCYQLVLSVVILCVSSCNFHWENSLFSFWFIFIFYAAGSMIDRITVFCSCMQDLQEWLEHLQPFTKGGSPAGTISKVRTPTHTNKYLLSIKSEQYQKWTLHCEEVWKRTLSPMWQGLDSSVRVPIIPMCLLWWS